MKLFEVGARDNGSSKLSSLDSSILIRKSLGVEDESNEDFEEPVERTVASRSER